MGFLILGLGYGVEGFRLKTWSLFRAWGLEFRVQGLGCRVSGVGSIHIYTSLSLSLSLSFSLSTCIYTHTHIFIRKCLFRRRLEFFQLQSQTLDVSVFGTYVPRIPVRHRLGFGIQGLGSRFRV